MARQIKNGIYRSDAKLSDGRLIRYYDSKVVERTATDKRPAEGPPSLGELRLDPLTNEWTIVAAHRTNRVFYPPKELCPLCPTSPAANENRFTEIPESDYEVAVFDNRFPSLNDPKDDWALPDLAGPDTDSNSAAGQCEVVCFTSEHDKSFKDLTESQLLTLITAWADRVAELSSLPYIQYVGLFENRGKEVGVTLHHPHSQIYAYSFVPPRAQKMLESALKFKKDFGKKLIDAIVSREIHEKVRLIAENSEWVAYVPYAAKYPFEIHVAPKTSVPDLAALSESQLSSWPQIAKNVMKKLDGVFGLEMPYIAAWHQSPINTGQDVMGLHWQITSVRATSDKLKYLAGSESAMGAFVMDITPEKCAEILRGA